MKFLQQCRVSAYAAGKNKQPDNINTHTTKQQILRKTSVRISEKFDSLFPI